MHGDWRIVWKLSANNPNRIFSIKWSKKNSCVWVLHWYLMINILTVGFSVMALERQCAFVILGSRGRWASFVFHSSASESGSQSTCEPLVTPTALAACTRVDSCFTPWFVPSLCMSFQLAHLEFRLCHHLDQLGTGMHHFSVRRASAQYHGTWFLHTLPHFTAAALGTGGFTLRLTWHNRCGPYSSLSGIVVTCFDIFPKRSFKEVFF